MESKTYKDKITEVATAIYPTCIETVNTVLMHGQSCGEKTSAIAASKMAVRYAVALLSEINHYYGLSLDDQKEY